MRHPQVLWAQRANELYVTIELPEIVNEKLELTETHMSFEGTSHDVEYKFKLEFYAPVLPENSKKTKQGRYMLCVIEKKDKDASWWPRLTKSKMNFVKTDFARWKDEDEEDEEDKSEDPMYNGMDEFAGMDFSQFGGGGGGEDEDDGPKAAPPKQQQQQGDEEEEDDDMPPLE